MTEKKIKKQKVEVVKELAAQKHNDIRFITEGNIPDSRGQSEFAVATDEGLFFYKYQFDELIPLSSNLWKDVDDGKVDFLALSTILTLNGENFRLTNEGKYIFRLAQEKSGVEFEQADRKWHQKILGFRTGVRWKQISAIIGYLFLFTFFNALLKGSLLDSLGTFIGFVVMGGLFVSFVALIKGEFTFFDIPNRKVAGLIFAAAIFLIVVIPNPFPDENGTSDTEENITASEILKAEQMEDEKAAEIVQEEKDKAEEEEKAEAAAKKAEEKEKAKAAAKKAEEEKKAEAAAKKAEEEKKAEAAAKKAEEKKKAKVVAEKKKVNETNATVTRVVDGDTIEVNMDGKQETVRLLLIDTPETVHPSEPVQPYGPEASQFVKDTLSGKKVRVKVGSEKRDHYGRLLAYVFIDGETIQEKLLEEGLARTAYLYNDVTMLDQFHQVQQSAIDTGKGVWSISGYAHVDHDHGYHYEEKPEPKPESKPAPSPQPKTEAPATNVNYKNCAAVREAGADPIRIGDPGYGKHLDRDGDGIACE